MNPTSQLPPSIEIIDDNDMSSPLPTPLSFYTRLQQAPPTTSKPKKRTPSQERKEPSSTKVLKTTHTPPMDTSSSSSPTTEPPSSSPSTASLPSPSSDKDEVKEAPYTRGGKRPNKKRGRSSTPQRDSPPPPDVVASVTAATEVPVLVHNSCTNLVIQPARQVPATAPAPPRPAASQAPKPKAVSKKASHPTLPKNEQAAAPRHLVDQLNLPTTSPVDLVIKVQFSAHTKRNTWPRLPHPTHKDQSSINTVTSLLLTSLDFPAPRLPRLCSSDPQADPHSFVESFKTLLSKDATVPPSGATYVNDLLSTLDHDLGYRAFYTKLTDPPQDLFMSHSHLFHSTWYNYLNYRTGAMTSLATASDQRHVIRLGLNTPIVKGAIRHHLIDLAARYCSQSDLLPPNADGTPPVPGYADMPPALQGWVSRAYSSGSISTSVEVSEYTLQYVTTETTDWSMNPGTHPAFSANGELHGNTQAVMDWLASAAPHCHPIAPTRPNNKGKGTVTFVHELTHRSELYQLLGKTAPEYGITRPLKLNFRQSHAPPTKACSNCGLPGHLAMHCTNNYGQPVCRDCYSPDHLNCHASPDQQQCRLCPETGHTSFHCKQYKKYYVPLSPPRESRPVNPNILTELAKQMGRAVPWSEVSAGLTRPPVPPPTSVPAPSPDNFPVMPRSRPAPSPAPSTASSAWSPPPSPPASSSSSSSSSSSPSTDALLAMILNLQKDAQRVREEVQREREAAQREREESRAAFQRLQDELIHEREENRRFQQELMMPLFAALKGLFYTPGPPPTPSDYLHQNISAYSTHPPPSLQLSQHPSPTPLPPAQPSNSWTNSIQSVVGTVVNSASVTHPTFHTNSPPSSASAPPNAHSQLPQPMSDSSSTAPSPPSYQ